MRRDRTVTYISSAMIQGTKSQASEHAIAIGDVDEWTSRGHQLPSAGNMAFLAYKELNEGTLEYYKPSVIYSPVLAADFDCIELATLLHNIGFDGTYRAVGNGLPKPDLIEREVRQMCRRITFEIVEL